MQKHNILLIEGQWIEDILLEAVAPLLEKTLNAEMDEHLGNEKHDYSQDGNYRNGFSKKSVKGLFGQTEIKTPRDRSGTFEPIIVAKN